MRKHVKGDRVGAIFGAKNGVCEFLGYGTYEGEAIPKEAGGFMAEAIRENNNTNPKIKLDNGKIVYGCECWWGSEEAIKEKLKAFTKIINVDIEKIREEHKEEENRRK